MSNKLLIRHRHWELLLSYILNALIFTFITGLSLHLISVAYPVIFIIWILIFFNGSDAIIDHHNQLIMHAMHQSSDHTVTILHHSQQNQRLWDDSHNLANQLHLQHPVILGIVHKPINDAVSISLNHSHLILFDQGLLDHLSNAELRVVVGHELGHFYDQFNGNRFRNQMNLQHYCFCGLILLFLIAQYYWFEMNQLNHANVVITLFVFLCYIIPYFINLLILRQSELLADNTSFYLTHDLNSSINTMLKIYDPSDSIHDFNNNQQIEHTLHVISIENGFGSIFDSHPSPCKRVKNFIIKSSK